MIDPIRRAAKDTFKPSQEGSIKIGDIVMTCAGRYALVINARWRLEYDYEIKYFAIQESDPPLDLTDRYYYIGLMKL